MSSQHVPPDRLPVQARGAGKNPPSASAMLAGPASERLETIQRALDAAPAPAQLKAMSTRLNGGQGGGEAGGGLPASLSAGIEALSGVSMADVRVHHDSAEPAQFAASAFARGNEIHLGPGQGRHLAHEAWHVAQQAQGRVAATAQFAGGMPINDDPALEHEADVMGRVAEEEGAAILAGAAEVGVAQRSAAGTAGRGVAQLAAPGGIAHAMNSCFVAALINTFTVVRPLRNLLIPGANAMAAGRGAGLQHLLWRAVNTVDAGAQVVPSGWVANIMAALEGVGIIGNAVDTADFSNVLAHVVTLLTEDDPTRAQTNNQPVTTGEIVWFENQLLQDAVGDQLAHMQDEGGEDEVGVRMPNAIQVTRNHGNAGVAPQSFRLYPANGLAVTYRLRAAIHADDAYVGGHFTSYVDRSNAGGQEWWHSDDLPPDDGKVAAVPSYAGSGMHRAARAYVYERVGSDLAPDLVAAQVGLGGLDGEYSDYLADVYQGALERYFAEDEDLGGYDSGTEEIGGLGGFEEEVEQGPKERKPIDLRTMDPKDYDKDLQQKAKDVDHELEVGIKAFRLPPVVTDRTSSEEVQRQLALQLESLNTLTVKDWAFRVMLNRMKSADQLVAGFSTPAGTRLKNKVDVILRGHHLLARALLGEIQDRMIALYGFFDPDKEGEARALAERTYMHAEESKHAEEPWLYFEYRGGVGALGRLSQLGVKGSIGRQHGEGDNTWFRSAHRQGITLYEQGKTTASAVLHNPDQVAGGQTEVVHSEEEKQLLDRAKHNFEEARNSYDRFRSPISQGVLDSAAEVYRDVVSRSMGDFAVNSLLGKTWLDDLGDGSSRIERLLDHARTIPLEDWEMTRMSVGMGVEVDDEAFLRPREKKAKTIEKQNKAFKSIMGSKVRKGGGRPPKSKDDKLKKIDTRRQTTLDEQAFRRRNPKAPDPLLLRGIHKPQYRFTPRAMIFLEYLEFLRSQEAPDEIDMGLARWSFRKGSTDHRRYLAYLERREREQQQGGDRDLSREDSGNGDPDFYE